MTINLSSWKTTVAGLAGAVLTVFVQFSQNGNKLDWHQLPLPLTIAVLGFLAKDFNTTGGTNLASGSIPDAQLHATAANEAVVPVAAPKKQLNE